MERTSLKDWACPAARALDAIGDWWTLLIIRECFSGVRRFSDFQANLGISKNILTRRLGKMEDDGLLQRRPSETDGRSLDYAMTEKGKSLFTILMALMQWGEDWQPCYEDGKPVFISRTNGRPLGRIAVTDDEGTPITPRDLDVRVEG